MTVLIPVDLLPVETLMRDFSVKLMTALACVLTLPGCSDTGKKEPEPMADYRPDYRHGLHTYKAFCGECHDTGKNGAPTLDDSEEWDNRALGFPALFREHASKGFLSMPEKGGHAELGDRDIADAVHYMIHQISSGSD
jgi:cytochrome c5